MLNSYKEIFAELILKSDINLSLEEIVSAIEMVPSNIKWDFGFPCFKLAKEFKKAPNQIAQDFVSQINDANVIAVWPYINYLLDSKDISHNIIAKINIEKNNFGKLAKNNQEIIVEWRQPNTHKAFHIWHFRNALVSNAVSSSLERAWYDIHRVAYPWDIW